MKELIFDQGNREVSFEVTEDGTLLIEVYADALYDDEPNNYASIVLDKDDINKLIEFLKTV